MRAYLIFKWRHSERPQGVQNATLRSKYEWQISARGRGGLGQRVEPDQVFILEQGDYFPNGMEGKA